MFTGIVKALGRVNSFERIGNTYRLAIETKGLFKDPDIGDSVAVNGICLTLVEKSKNILRFDVIEETMRKTTLKNIKKGDVVNLEGSLKVGDPLSGHFVLGHIDCAGRIRNIEKSGETVSMEIEVPEEFSDYVVHKGSVAIDGISLTIGEIKKNRFKVYIIPHTLKATALGSKGKGDELNVEFDILGKYAAKLKNPEADSRITESFLKSKGFD